MIRQKFPRRRKIRSKLQLANSQLDYLRQEWKSGELHPGSPDIDALVEFSCIRDVSASFNLARKSSLPKKHRWGKGPTQVAEAAGFRDAAEPIIKQIEDWADVRLPKREDCPFIGLEDWMPEDWCWLSYYKFFILRRDRMTCYCNRAHPTVDDAITLFIECILQVIIRVMDCGSDDIKKKLQNKHKKFLCLPINIVKGSPLCLSIGHRHYGQQMKTGWTMGSLSLKDRLDKNNDNNICIKIHFSNFFKFFFFEKYINDIQSVIPIANMFNSFFNSNIKSNLYN
ncbi:hypothetical protein GGTG_10557 [Gaeumannomyces tritici R3-111a-1]|uniref:Uncharacterized protein n=1 Tax=Gaeumannomyces tritici (strain R3-111a-1) TaxID=644352 RepID=J3PAN2_GAET3|nr:hypothetical protein GGTG_10557 [Gaeumannomyces tritici R3-111a-1]EJT71298.1 hypothetical protein GGTG_10557 [Gaeumannomyces tritici R3-111a-1]